LWISKRSRLSLSLLLLLRESCSGALEVLSQADDQSQSRYPCCSRCRPFQQGRSIRNGNSVQEGGRLLRVVHRRELSFLHSSGLKLTHRSSSKVRCLITTISQDVTSSDQELSTSGKPSRVRQWTVDWADGRMVRRRDQEARCSGMLFPNVHFSWSIGEGEGSLGGFLPRGRMGHQGVSPFL
jgi:hypothetical protein